jgi:tetratricopeptide (TPR) repeat protein
MALLKRDYKNAEKYLLKAAPQAPAAWYGLARLYLLDGKFADAKKWAKKIVDSGEGDRGAEQMLEAAEKQELSPELRRTIEPPPLDDRTSADTMRGWRLFNQGRASEAKEIFQAALQANADDGAAQNGMGWCLLVSGESSEAKPYFEKLIQADPNAAGAMNGLARVLMADGDIQGAIKIWEDSLKVSQGATASMHGLADAYCEIGEYSKAAPLLERLLALQPDDARLKAKLARAREMAQK